MKLKENIQLKEIYKPIQNDLFCVEDVLNKSLKKTKNPRILEINNYLLESPGKRIRPALVILSAKASSSDKSTLVQSQLYDVAGAVELIHMASIIHDDAIDHSKIRHNRSTVNSKWGAEVSIALGDYLYAEAFELIARCGNMDILKCFTFAAKAMCEGELRQVYERDNLDLLKEHYLIIAKKKTASLFAASCMAGGLVSHSQESIQAALREYGLNFGITFQIIDDYLDVVGSEDVLGKEAGQDIKVGEMTLPILNLLECVQSNEREKIRQLFSTNNNELSLQAIKAKFLNSDASVKTEDMARSFVNLAKGNTNVLEPSIYKDSLINLTEFAFNRGFNFN